MPDDIRIRTPVWQVLLTSAAFALAHTQSPLFFSNQNQYLLHGFAESGHGHLASDWLSTTKDPTPAFTFLVASSLRVFGPFALQISFFALIMAYFAAVWRLVTAFANVRLLPFAAMFTAAHAAIFRLASVRITGTDYPWYFQSGVAGQYLIGPGLQPSAFGVLLVMSLAAFARGRLYWAAVLAAATTVAHATYLMPAALLVVGYAFALERDGRRRAAIGIGLAAMAIAGPVALYAITEFRTGTPKITPVAEDILANIRIPHHTQISRWFDLIAGLQIAWIVLGLALIRRTRLFIPLATAFILSAILTVAQVFAKDDAFALTFPWRISVLLVPVATAAVAARLAELDRGSHSIKILAFFLLALQAVGGALIMNLGLGYHQNEAEEPLLKWVREHSEPGDKYLIPTSIPPLATGSRGSRSTSFTPPPRPKPGSNLIPVDLQRFRLLTGTPIYVDFKSVPYATEEVIEWRGRMNQAETWYRDQKWDDAETREAIKKVGITHVVITRSSRDEPPILADDFQLVYEDPAYAVYKLR